jgi:hypothetical protein
MEEELMPLLTLIVTLVAVGVLLWLIGKYVPMEPKIKQTLNVIVLVVVVLWLLQMFFPGFFESINNVKVGR